MSARRINVGIQSPCPCCGYHVRHEQLGKDEPAHRTPREARWMRVPLDDRIAHRRSDVAA